MIIETLSNADFVNNVLLSELRLKAAGRSIQIVSDFDETQASEYIFSSKWNTHVPKIRKDLIEEAQRLVNPMCLATARASSEAVSWVMWKKLSRLPMPLVAENGAILVWPSKRITQPANIEVLTSSEQFINLRRMQEELQNGLIDKLKVPRGHQVILQQGRVATVEIRAQDIITKTGTPNDYNSLKEQLYDLFPELMSQVEIISSGSSLGIQPVGINKESGIRSALSRSGIKIKDIFLLGIGDNKNDEPLFNFVKQNDGLTIGVRPSVGSACDFTFDSGDEVSTQILKAINSL